MRPVSSSFQEEDRMNREIGLNSLSACAVVCGGVVACSDTRDAPGDAVIPSRLDQ